MLIEAYVTLDSFLLDRANDVVKAWNWTTGGTRADLASLIIIPGLSGLPAAHFINGNYGSVLLGGVVSGLLGLVYVNEYTKMDRLESEALNNNARNFKIEKNKNKYKIFGPMFNLIGFSTLIQSNQEDSHPLSNELTSMFGLGIGTSMYIMRTDYQAPRKNVVVRAKDKLADMLRQPTTVPIQPFTPLDSQEQ